MIDLQKTTRLIADFEGFVGHVYDDGFGNETIGYGETDKAIIKRYRNSGISEPEAFALLTKRVEEFWNNIKNYITNPTPNQAAAYTSLSYNIGIGAFRESTTLKRHNAGDTNGAAEAILWWNKVNGKPVEGLTRRRRREYDLYLSGDKPAPMPLDVSKVKLLTVKLVSMNSALCLDIAEVSQENGATLQQWHGTDGDNQEFSIVPVPDGEADEVAIICAHSGKVLDVAEYSKIAGARVQQWEYHGGPNQRWRIFAVGNILQFQNVNSGLWLDVGGVSIDAGAQIVQWDRNDQLNQMFMRVRQLTTAVVNPLPGPIPPDEKPEPTPDPNFDVPAALKSMGFPFGNEEDIYGFQGGFSFYALVVDGQAGPATVTAIKYSLDRGGRCGEFFTFSEFGCKHCGRPRIWREQVRALDGYRRHVGPVTIVSGTRCDEHNRKVGGASNSQHRPFPNNRGVSTATDIPGSIHVNDMRKLRLFSGIGYVRSSGLVVHVDSRGDGPNNTTGGSKNNPTTWEYG